MSSRVNEVNGENYRTPPSNQKSWLRQWFDLECWTSVSDVHGLGGTPRSTATLEQCQAACVNDSTCLAVDWETANPDDHSCWLLTSTPVLTTLETGVITHYGLNRLCLSEYLT